MKRFYVAIFVIAFIVVMASPVMAVKSIEVSGNEKFSSSEILYMAGFKDGVNIFAFSAGKASQSFEENPYIKSVAIEKDYLKRTLTFEVVERRLSGYIKFNGNNYLYIDRDGMVLESKTSFVERRPVIEGLEFSEFSIGEYLKVDNTKIFDNMVVLSHLFEKFEIEHDIMRVDLSKADEIHFYYGNIDIQLGSASDLDLKVRTVKEILPKLEQYKETGGFLYMQDPLSPRFTISS